MNVLLKEREVGFYLADSGREGCSSPGTTSPRRPRRAPRRPAPSCILVEPGEFEAAARPRPTPTTRSSTATDDDTAVILYTSGTTGTPKGAELTHANLAAQRRGRRRAARRRREHGRARRAAAVPLLRPDLRAERRDRAPARCLTLIPRFDPGKALEIIERDRVDDLRGRADDVRGDAPPPRARALRHLVACELCVSGGAAMPVEVLRGFEDAFGCMILEGYGLSETSPVASFNHPDRERKPGSIGTPIEGVEMKVVDDDGNEVAAGRAGRDRDPRPQRDEGLLEPRPTRPPRRSTPTAGSAPATWPRVDDDGYFFIVDRKKDLIIRGGYNVYPREIEEVLYEHPAVREAAVVGVPARRARRGGRRRGRAQGRRGGDRGRAARVRQGAGRRLQVPAPRSGSSTSCPRARPARSSSARSSCRPTSPKPTERRARVR